MMITSLLEKAGVVSDDNEFVREDRCCIVLMRTLMLEEGRCCMGQTPNRLILMCKGDMTTCCAGGRWEW